MHMRLKNEIIIKKMNVGCIQNKKHKEYMC